MLSRFIEITPAYDKRDADPGKDFGIGSVAMKWVVKGSKGAVQFFLLTNWYLPHLNVGGKMKDPLPADLGYHSLVPHYDGQLVMQDKCQYLDGKPCYYDGSGLNAEPVYDLLLRKGGEAVWKYLEQYYADMFGEEK